MAGVEFSRIVRVDRLKSGGPQAMTVEASPREREALAVRFELLDMGKFEASLDLEVEGSDQVTATGRLVASVVQSCVVTLEPVETVLEIPVRLRFVPERLAASASPAHDLDGEALASEEEEDVETYADGAFDLGEVLAQTLSMHLPAYPRSENAGEAGRTYGDAAEAGGDSAASPFAKLAGLKGAGQKKGE